MSIQKEALCLYPIDKQVITTADGHEIHYDENEGLRNAYEIGRKKSESDISRLTAERKELVDMIRQYIKAYETSILPNPNINEDAVLLLNGMGE